MRTTIVTHQYEFSSENPIATFGAGWTLVGSVTRPLFFRVGSSLDDIIAQFNSWQDVGTEAPLTKRIVLHQIEYTRLYGTDVVTITYPMISSDADPVIAVTGSVTDAERAAFVAGAVGAGWVVTNRVQHAVVTLTATTSRKGRTSTNPRFLCGLEAIDYVRTPKPANPPPPPPPPPPLVTVPGAPTNIFASMVVEISDTLEGHANNIPLAVLSQSGLTMRQMSSVNIPFSVTGSQAITIPTDPYSNNVSLLLRGDGSNGSTSIVDSSPAANSISVRGNAQISTAQSKFGGSSLYFDGSGDSLVIDPSTAFGFGTGDFTIECFVFLNANAISTGVTLLDFRIGLTVNPFTMYIVNRGSGNMLGVYSGLGVLSAESDVAIPIGVWTHTALVRAGGLFSLFLNGTLLSITQGGASAGTGDFGNSCPVSIGAAAGGAAAFFNGYINDLRITKGVARYTSNFTPSAI